MHLRLQTWFPFLAQFCLNGREWLARMMDAEGLGYTRQDNCFTRLADPARAQQLLDSQLRTDWNAELGSLLAHYHPTHQKLRSVMPLDYYWTISESEHATDVMFKDRASLRRVYPSLVHHSVMSFEAEQVLGFLGRKQAGKSEVLTDRRRREPGVRVKHWVDKNSIKLYDKGSVLRSEVTVNQPGAFKVWRKAGGKPAGEKGWRQLRRTVADAPRRASEPCGRRQAPRRARPSRVRGAAASAAQGGVRAGARQGVRHRDLRAALARRWKRLTPKQLAGRVGRHLRLFRAHGLLIKISRTHRYRLSAKARKLIPCVLAAASASTPQLTKLAT